MASEGAEFVQTRYGAFDNIGTTGKKIVESAGLVAWEKLFQNLRASRETELMEFYPAKDVSAWLGNSEPVAMKHYAMARESTFVRATELGAKREAVQFASQSGAECGAVEDGTGQHSKSESA